MSQLSKQHQELNELGIGKCSVPMWSGGLPDGFCNRDAYGFRPRCKEFQNAYSGAWIREDGKYSGYVPALACPAHGGPAIRTFKDGNAWCAVMPDFKNLHDSESGWGDTAEEAIQNLLAEINKPPPSASTGRSDA